MIEFKLDLLGVNMKVLSKIKNVKSTLENYRRVLILAKKPTMKEFKETAKVCAIGIAIIGLFGFTFYILSILVGA